MKSCCLTDYAAANHYPVVLYLHQLDMGNYREGLLKQVNGWFNTKIFSFTLPVHRRGADAGPDQRPWRQADQLWR